MPLMTVLRPLPYSQALSIDPINPHVLELLNMALEANIMRNPPPIDETEASKTIRTLKEKYMRFRDSESAKGKDKAPRDVPSDVGDADGGDEMNLG
jgi:anaphase-promoting complex subunit 6